MRIGSTVIRAIRRTLKTKQRTESSMRNYVLIVAGLTALASAPFGFAGAHEAHQAKCSETKMNALRADIQAMEDGDAKTAAAKEMQMAEEMMAKQDIEGCAAHIHNAMEAIEE